MSYIHPTLAKEFGEDYSKIFGPVEDRDINLTSLAYDDEELERIIKQ